MTTISAKIITDSISPEDVRITTIEARYPRFIHAELMTHRVFSRNARSSRAVPVETMLREIETDPVVPLFWGKNQKGMRAREECDEPIKFRNDSVPRETAWLRARDVALMAAAQFQKAGYHKQIVNRLLEPFMHIDVLITATEWSNFFALRDHEAAEPHIQVLAREVRLAQRESIPVPLYYGEWHLPYVRYKDRDILDFAETTGQSFQDLLLKVSTARCARISYAPFDGDASIESELRRYDLLVGSHPMHASPAEHQATPMMPGQEHLQGNLRGWVQYRKTLQGECQ